MSNSADSSMHSAKSSHSVHVDLLEGELNKRFSSQEAELASLREMNSQLRAQLAETKKIDLERATFDDHQRANELELQRLRKSESSLRIALATQDSDQERRIEEAQRSVESLKSELEEQKALFAQTKDDFNRKLAKLTDENWAKDLELESLRSQQAAEEAVSMRQKAEISIHLGKLHDAMVRQNDLENLLAEKEADTRALNDEHSRAIREMTKVHASEIESLQEANAAARAQIGRLSADLARLESELQMAQKSTESQVAKVRAEQERQKNDSERFLAGLRSEYERQISELRMKWDEDRGEFGRIDSDRQARIQQLEAECAERSKQLGEAHQLLAELEHALKSSATELQSEKEQAAQTIHGLNQQLTHQAEAFRTRENQLAGEVSRLRTECSDLDKLLNEANEALRDLRATFESQRNQWLAERRNLEVEAEKRRVELQSELQAKMQSEIQRAQSEFQQQFDAVASENKKMRQLLDVRDTQTESDRKNLKQWQEQLNFLDQYLRQSKDALKKDKAEILRLAKQLTNEMLLARNHPFMDYVELAELEVSHLQVQLNNTSSLSPTRSKIEERLAQMTEHRDFLRVCLAKSQRVVEERLQILASISKSANAPV